MLLFAAILSICTMNAETRFALDNSQAHKISLNSFSKLSVSNAVNVTYVPTRTGKYELTVVSNKPHKGDVVINNSGNKLTIELALPNENNIDTNKFDVQITVTGPILKDMSTSRGAKVNVTSAMATGSFSATTSSGGSIKMVSLNVTDKLDVETSSGGSFSLKEKSSAGSLDIECTSGSRVELSAAMSAKDTAIEVSSGSSLTLKGLISPSVDIEASSAGKVDISDVETTEIKIEASSTDLN